MTPFRTLEAVAAPLPFADVDTDKILAARFLTTVTRAGLGQALFSSLRDSPDFILNRPPWMHAGILVTLSNFGCGSSREHAPWALLDFGIRCIIAPSFADIFYNNCFKNGILAVVLPQSSVDQLMILTSQPATARLFVDLESQTVIDETGYTYLFQVDARRKRNLLDGVDEICATLAMQGEIERYEMRRATNPSEGLTRPSVDINTLIK